MKIPVLAGLALALVLGGCAALQSKQAEPLALACMGSVDEAMFAADRWQQRSNLAVGSGEFPSLVDVTTVVNDSAQECDGSPALVLMRFTNHPWLPDSAAPKLVAMFKQTAAEARRDYARYQDAMRP